MKPLILTIGTLILYLNLWIGNNDIAMLSRENNSLKYIANQASVSATLYWQQQPLSNGIVIFDDVECMASARGLLESNMRLDDLMVPVVGESYWSEQAHYIIYLFDDSMVARVYRDGVQTSTFNFVYPYLYVDDRTGFTKVITRPAACVTVDGGKGRSRSPIFPVNNNSIRSGAHEIERKENK